MIPFEEFIQDIGEVLPGKLSTYGAQVYELWLTMLETTGLPARSWGRSLQSILRIASEGPAVAAKFRVMYARGRFLDYASGTALTHLARQMYGVDRQPATSGSGPIRLTNTGTQTFGPGDYPAGSVRAYNPLTGAKYISLEPLNLAPGQSKLFQFEAEVAGTDGSSPANSITRLETQLLGVSSVANPSAIVGRDEEDDEALRAACRAAMAARSQLGIRGAYEWAVRQARRTDGSPTAITRPPYVSESSSVAEVYVYVATPTGAPSTDDIEAAVTSIENLARPAGVRVYVAGATEVAYERVLTLYVRKGVSSAAAATIKTAADKGVARLISTAPIGGDSKPGLVYRALFGDAVKQAAWAAVQGLATVYEVDLDDDSDLVLEAHEVATNHVTVNVVVQQ